MRFPTTRWQVVDELKASEASRRKAALAELMELYWRPLYAFLRCDYSREEAEDLVQEFFTHCLESDVLVHADASRGRFRSFLLTCIKRFASNRDRLERAQKRNPESGLMSIEELITLAGPALEPKSGETPESAFHRVWIQTTLLRVLADYERRCKDLKLADRYEMFHLRIIEPILSDTPKPSFASLGEQFGLSENAANKAVIRASSDFRRLIESELLGNVEDEMKEDASAVLSLLPS